MLSFDQIKDHYPVNLVGGLFFQHMLKEYLQTMILSSVYSSSHATRLVFIGGTCLRFCHGLDRFSEDLDFDYHGDDREELREVFDQVSRDIQKQGLACVTEHHYDRGDNYCRIVFPGITETYKLGDLRKNIWIKIDIQKNKTSYKNEVHYVNRFGFFFPVHLPKKDILLSMKAVALTARTKARDMYDFSFLSPNAGLDMAYIVNELGIRGFHVDSPGQVKELILQKEAGADISEKVHEISLFLIEKNNASRVAHFYPWLRSIDVNEL